MVTYFVSDFSVILTCHIYFSFFRGATNHDADNDDGQAYEEPNTPDDAQENVEATTEC